MRSRLPAWIAATVAGVLAATIAPPAKPASAAPTITITRIFYDSPGIDRRTNASLNAEYIVLRNTSGRRLNLNRWTVRDANRHVYRFSGSFRLAAGRSIVLHTGRGVNTAQHRYWGYRNYVWNNTTDTAYVRNPAGRLVDSCRYRGPNNRSPRGAFVRC